MRVENTIGTNEPYPYYDKVCVLSGERVLMTYDTWTEFEGANSVVGFDRSIGYTREDGAGCKATISVNGRVRLETLNLESHTWGVDGRAISKSMQDFMELDRIWSKMRASEGIYTTGGNII